jgi:quercetin dioxygenase-like cupin family protein
MWSGRESLAVWSEATEGESGGSSALRPACVPKRERQARENVKRSKITGGLERSDRMTRRPRPIFLQSLNMRKSRAAALVLLATATLAQPQQTVEITSEPSHHLVLQNDYVRVFDVTVAPKATTLIHRHNYDYLFVTLGDSDLTNARVGEKPAALQLKDGDVRFTPGHFAHAAINNASTPFHNITIELLKPSTNVKTCTQNCDHVQICAGICPYKKKLISSDQWTVWMVGMQAKGGNPELSHEPQLIIPVSDLAFSAQQGTAAAIQRAPGQIDWLPTGVMHPLYNTSAEPARFVVLEFNAESVKP